jgi:hypothetical protein
VSRPLVAPVAKIRGGSCKLRFDLSAGMISGNTGAEAACSGVACVVYG